MEQVDARGGTTPNEALASVVRREQGDRTWSLNDLADASGIPAATLRRYRSGERQINVDHLFRLADAFEMSPEALLGLARAQMAVGPTRPAAPPTRRKRLPNVRTSEQASRLSALVAAAGDGVQDKPTTVEPVPTGNSAPDGHASTGRPHAI